MKNKSTSFLTLIFLAAFGSSLAQTLDVYVTAHPDDWQLFMNPNAYNSVKTEKNSVIFLHTTAGDAGAGTGNNNYYLAREEGSLRAIRFMQNIFSNGSGLGTDMAPEMEVVNGKKIKKMTYGNTEAYFLRLPDGNYYGDGYPVHDSTSIKKLVEGNIQSIKAIDGSATYSSLSDLKATLKQLISKASEGKTALNLHIAETDTLANPDDHSDHRFTSLLMQQVAKELPVNAIYFYEEYATNKKPYNVFDTGFLVSAGTWAATGSGLSDMGHPSTWDEVHNSWIGRQYYRVEMLAKDEE